MRISLAVQDRVVILDERGKEATTHTFAKVLAEVRWSAGTSGTVKAFLPSVPPVASGQLCEFGIVFVAHDCNAIPCHARCADSVKVSQTL